MIIKSFEIEKSKEKIKEKNIFLLYGENQGLKQDIKDIIIEQNKSIIKKDIKIINYYEENFIKSQDELYNLIYAGSLFDDKKIIVLKNASDKFHDFIKDNLIKKFPNGLVLILISEILDKKSKLRIFCEKDKSIYCIPCYQDNIRSLEILLNLSLEEEKLKMSNESKNLLIERANGDRNNLRNEFNKIKLFANKTNQISFLQVKELTNSAENFKSENLINKCLSGEKKEFKKILSEIYLETPSYIMMLKIFSRKIERLIKIQEQRKQNQSVESLINTIKPPVFWKDKPILKRQIEIWKKEDLFNIVNKINRTEIECKKNTNISLVAFLRLFIFVCNKANSYS